MTTTHKILCGSCKTDLKGPSDPKPDDVITCPTCGNGDTFENVLREAKEYIANGFSKSLGDMLAKSTRNSKFVKFKSQRAPQRSYRFVVDAGV